MAGISFLKNRVVACQGRVTTSEKEFSDSLIHGMIRVRIKTVDDKSWEPKTKVKRVVPISSKLKIYLEKYPIPGVEG
jgi:hypothetical protein